ncbi:MAG: hypothetical protein WB609_11855 [Candidatus Cybelea sp.]
MKILSRLLLPVVLVGLAIVPGIAHAQESPTSPSPASPTPTVTPAPAVTPQPTFMDREYDGRTHIIAAPYIWGPTIKANYQFSIPRLPSRGGGGKIVGSTVLVGPSDYLPKLNTAGMLAFDVRKGDVDVFGDGIYINASTTATIATLVQGPRGHVKIPVTFNAAAHLTTAIWELAAGLTIAHGHNADASGFIGVREFPIDLNADYNVTISKHGIVSPTGTIATSDSTNDVIFGIRGRAFFSDHFYATYYGDFGTGSNNQTWQAYGGAGYAFPHGQTIIALWRTVDYNAFPPGAHVQKFDLSGPLLGYTFNL